MIKKTGTFVLFFFSLLLFGCLFVCSFFIVKKQYFEAFLCFIALLFVLSDARATFLWKVRPFFPGS